MDGRIYHIKNLLAEHLEHPWTVEEMAAGLNLSASHFLRLFRAHMGTAPIAYLNSLRLAKAGQMLSDPSNFLRMKEICFLVGFSSESQFSRDFKLTYGLTPTRYRMESFERGQEGYAQNSQSLNKKNSICQEMSVDFDGDL